MIRTTSTPLNPEQQKARGIATLKASAAKASASLKSKAQAKTENSVPEIAKVAISKVATDGGTQSRSAIYENVVDDYVAALSDGAVFPAIVVFYDGEKYWLADGFHRFHAHKKAGRAEIEADIRQGTRRDAILHSVGANEAHGLRRTNEDKRRAVLTLLNDEEWGAKPERWIAATANVSHTFVQKLRASHLATLPDKPAEREVTRNGTTYTMNTAGIGKPDAEPSPAEPPVEKFDPVQEREIIDAAKEIAAKKPEVAAEIMFGNEDERERARRIRDEQGLHVRGTLGTGENEWYTPAEHLDLARKVLGSIDLDPASSETANRTVGAEKFFAEADNGLDKPWFGKVWLNPPYAQPAIAHFADKMVEEWGKGDVEAAIVLTHNYTDTAWFQKMARASAAICFTRGRVRFVSPEGELAAPTQGQAFFYFGHDVDAFAEVFAAVGFVVEVRQ